MELLEDYKRNLKKS